MKYYVYLVECSDQSLYTGYTTDINRRLKEHNTDKVKGAKSIKGKLPVKLVHLEKFTSRGSAMKREREIKGWKREKKVELVKRQKYY